MDEEAVYQKLDERCKKAIEGLKLKETGVWLNSAGPLYQSISIRPDGLPSIANAHFNGKHYEATSEFHHLYVQKESVFLAQSSHFEVIVYFIQRMNIYELNHYLDDIFYQNKTKNEFISSLADVFNRIKINGNNYLAARSGTCKGCNFGKSGFAFVGIVDGSYFDLIFKENDNRVSDIFECNFFECAYPEANVVEKRIVFK